MLELTSALLCGFCQKDFVEVNVFLKIVASVKLAISEKRVFCMGGCV